MISKSEIETYAGQIAEPDFETASIEPLIGHLGDAEFEAVMDRAAEISSERGLAAHAEADALRSVVRLAKATGIRAGGKPVPWLQERGLIEEVDGGFRFKTAKPGAVT
jgi:hypothetical protein